ncbi:hypothetical protein CBS101457_003189 [Exobasidium rhododendri]|nr:hypothetical protein CBS101457_003189 [Exobasidium rhododendri]
MLRRGTARLSRCYAHTELVSIRFASSSSPSSTSPPLFQLHSSVFPNLHEASSPLSLTIHDHPQELWAVIAPHSSSSAGSKLLAKILSTLSSQSRPQQRVSSTAGTRLHPSPHLFTSNTRLVALASFSKQQVSSNAEFQDFSARYGALREEDTVTVFESLMDTQGFEVGKIAAMKVLPDKLRSDVVEESERRLANTAKIRIEKLAPLLGLHKPGPGSIGGVPLLYSPVISLSNGQLRRARIVNSLVRLDEASSTEDGQLEKSLLILDQPYSGLDESSRLELSELLGKLHAKGTPRVILVLRRQDDLPSVVTHIVDVDTDGRVWIGSREDWKGSRADVPSGVEGIRKNRKNGIGVGHGKELVNLSSITVQYGDKVILDAIDLEIREGSRLIVKGANGSGKTTLLSLLNGSHPQSYSFDPANYTLFGKERGAPSNATRILMQRIGYFGPDLLASFPRKGLDSGGLSIKDAVSSGFQGVFSRVSLNAEQEAQVDALLTTFRGCISFRDQGARVTEDNQSWWDRSFIELDGGSQSIVLFLRAVVGRPAIIILDEPFQGMDAVQINLVRQFIDGLGKHDSVIMSSTAEARQKDMEKAKNCAVVLVSHYINEWPNGMGEYMLLDNGRVTESV